MVVICNINYFHYLNITGNVNHHVTNKRCIYETDCKDIAKKKRKGGPTPIQ